LEIIEMKIIYEPFKEIVVKDFAKFEKINDLLYMSAQLRAVGEPVALNWAEGVVFIHVPMVLDTDKLIEEFLKGRLYYAGVNFSLMDKYNPLLVYKSQQGEISVPIINVNSSKILSKLAKWLKMQS
jgi:hypothetical protein